MELVQGIYTLKCTIVYKQSLVVKRIVAIWILLLPLIAQGQIYESVNCDISIYSEAPIQDVQASNDRAVSYFDLSTNYILFDVIVEDFNFEQGMMEQQFNDRYMETSDYPKAEFFGKVIGFDPHQKGMQEVTAMGELTIHGVTNMVKSSGRMKVSEDGQLYLISKFIVNIEDYSVDPPRLLFHPIAEEVSIKVEAKYHLTGS